MPPGRLPADWNARFPAANGTIVIAKCAMDPTDNTEQTYQLLSLAISGGRIGTWYWRLDTDQHEWSDLCQEYLMLPSGVAPSFEHFRSVLHPKDRERIEALVTAAIETRADYQAEYRVLKPDGSTRWLSARGRVFRQPQGHTYAMAGILTDITETKANEARLRETLALFQRVYEHASIGIAIADLQGRFERCNPAYETMLGYSEAELRQMNFAALIHPDDRETNLAEVARLASGQVDGFTIENRYLHKDGQTIWARKLGSLLPGDKDSPAQMLALVEDVTGSKRAWELLAESRDWLDLALAGAELGTWDTDMVTGQTRNDERSLAMLGYGPEEIEPTREGWTQHIHPEDLPAVNEAMRAHLAGETRVYEVEYRLRHKEGRWVWVLTRGKVYRDSDGRPTRAAGTHLDITHRKRVATEGPELLRRIENLIAGLERKSNPAQPDPGETSLSARHREVLSLIAEGLTSAQIALRLGISNETAITHRRNLMRKLGLHNKADLIRYALQHELGAPGGGAKDS